MKRSIFLLSTLFVFALSGCGETERFSRESTYKESNDKSVTLSISEDSITSKGLTLTIKNNTDKDITYGEDYVLEQKRNDKWYKSNDEQSFTALGNVLEANGTDEQKVSYSALEDGEHRIIKIFNSDSEEFELCAEFDLKGEK